MQSGSAVNSSSNLTLSALSLLYQNPFPLQLFQVWTTFPKKIEELLEDKKIEWNKQIIWNKQRFLPLPLPVNFTAPLEGLCTRGDAIFVLLMQLCLMQWIKLQENRPAGEDPECTRLYHIFRLVLGPQQCCHHWRLQWQMQPQQFAFLIPHHLCIKHETEWS